MIIFCHKCYRKMETEETTCPRCGSPLGIKKDNGSYFFPASLVTKEVPAFERAQLICMIPEGRVATETEIRAFFHRRYNCDEVQFAPPTPIFAKREKGRLVPIIIPQPGQEVETIPNWRVVSQRGFVDFLSAEKLRQEGVEVVESGRGYRVPAYKEIGVRFDRLLTEVKDAPVWTIWIFCVAKCNAKEDVQRSLQAGMNAHLTKPVEPNSLYQVLGELIYKAENAD